MCFINLFWNVVAKANLYTVFFTQDSIDMSSDEDCTAVKSGFLLKKVSQQCTVLEVHNHFHYNFRGI